MTDCTPGHWHRLLEDFHKSPFDNIYVEREALNDVIQCHRQYVIHYPVMALIVKEPHPQAKEILCRRAEVFELIKSHGELCGTDIEIPS